VQGSAGSGKTSIALHRIAFLFYEGLHSRLRSDNVLILSPNNLFNNYIYSVLPELGEETVTQLTFDEIASNLLSQDINPETKLKQLEIMLNTAEYSSVRQAGVQFKGSIEFLTILNRLLKYYAHKVIPFQDLYFDGKVLVKREILKNRFLRNDIGIPMAKQLQKLEKTILDIVHPLRKKRLQKIMNIVQKSEGHELEVKTFARYLSILEAQQFTRKLLKFTRVYYLEIYKLLFRQKGLLNSLAYGLDLPADIDQIISETNDHLNEGKAFYEDCTPLIYLKVLVEGNAAFSHIRHAVIDEAQDYSLLQYNVFNHLFGNARFTILGDINQALGKTADKTLYAEIASIMNKPETVTVTLNTGYRSTLEINTFNEKVLGKAENITFFERHGEEPKVINVLNSQMKAQAIIQDIEHFAAQGLSVAVICKTLSEAEKACTELKNISEIRLIGPNEEEIGTCPLIIPVYLAKGLEFDVVIIYNADCETYHTESDRKILYVACTRAMHFLRIYYTDEISPLLPE
jgi:DNA helicase-2/ATP-dependent DNA helicase PcrA